MSLSPKPPGEPGGAAAPPPAISVVIPTYDRAELLPRAIDSVLAQTWQDFELLVVDDGSRDGTGAILQAQDDPRVRTFRQGNRGVCAARNLGLAHARGRWITFLDSDDEAEREWLDSILQAARQPGVGIVTLGARVVERSGEESGSEQLLSPLYAPWCRCRVRATAGCLATRRDLLEDVGGYAEELRYAENSELALRLLPACRDRGLEVAVVDRPLVVYHRDPTAWSRDDRAFGAVRQAAELILDRHGGWLRRAFPAGYANYRGVAAINAARLGDVAAARRHLWSALRAEPRRPQTWGRLALTLVPPLARLYWRRHGQPAAAVDTGDPP